MVGAGALVGIDFGGGRLGFGALTTAAPVAVFGLGTFGLVSLAVALLPVLVLATAALAFARPPGLGGALFVVFFFVTLFILALADAIGQCMQCPATFDADNISRGNVYVTGAPSVTIIFSIFWLKCALNRSSQVLYIPHYTDMSLEKIRKVILTSCIRRGFRL